MSIVEIIAMRSSKHVSFMALVHKPWRLIAGGIVTVYICTHLHIYVYSYMYT
jgi:hypothetical protein